MTYKEFLTKLQKTPRTWSLQKDHAFPGGTILRLNTKCPLEIVGNTEGCWLASLVLGIREAVASRIVLAADGKKTATRRDLIKACGLKEKA